MRDSVNTVLDQNSARVFRLDVLEAKGPCLSQEFTFKHGIRRTPGGDAPL